MNKNYQLSKIIFNDLILFHKKQLILFIIILLSAILLVATIHKTRLLISKKNDLDIIKQSKIKKFKNF